MFGRPKQLRPAGHNALIEAMIQPAIVIGSTIMSAVAAYVMALNELTHILSSHGTWQDWFLVGLCAGTGLLIDMALIVAATRYKMHLLRHDPREGAYLTLAKWVLVTGICVEGATLFYFVVQLDTSAYPEQLVWFANVIHAVLSLARAVLPPTILAFFAAGVLPISYDRADRNREILAETSQAIMTLIRRLTRISDTSDVSEQVRTLAGLLHLGSYADYDTQSRTSEADQVARDELLVAHLARLHNLDWHAQGHGGNGPEDLPPTPTTRRTNGHADPLNGKHPREEVRPFPGLQVVSGRVAVKRARVGKKKPEEVRQRRAFALLNDDPEMSIADLQKALRTRPTTAAALYAQWKHSQRKVIAQ